MGVTETNNKQQEIEGALKLGYQSVSSLMHIMKMLKVLENPSTLGHNNSKICSNLDSNLNAQYLRNSISLLAKVSLLLNTHGLQSQGTTEQTTHLQLLMDQIEKLGKITDPENSNRTLSLDKKDEDHDLETEADDEDTCSSFIEEKELELRCKIGDIIKLVCDVQKPIIPTLENRASEPEPSTLQVENEVADEPTIGNMPIEDYSYQNGYSLKDGTNTTTIERTLVLNDDLIVIIKKSLPKKEGDKTEYTLYVFDLNKMQSPIFSYVLQGYEPISVHGITRLVSKPDGENAWKIVLFLCVRDLSTKNKVCLQVVFVDQKKFKNMMFGKEGINPLKDTYFRLRDNGDKIDMLFCIGEKFVHYRFGLDDPDWSIKLKDNHTMIEIFDKNSISGDMVDFQFDGSISKDVFHVAVLTKSGAYYTIKVLRFSVKDSQNKFLAQTVFEKNEYNEYENISRLFLDVRTQRIMLAGLKVDLKSKKASLMLSQLLLPYEVLEKDSVSFLLLSISLARWMFLRFVDQILMTDRRLKRKSF